jgi:hypothetical protein
MGFKQDYRRELRVQELDPRATGSAAASQRTAELFKKAFQFPQGKINRFRQKTLNQFFPLTHAGTLPFFYIHCNYN